jgi:hypothetical protein
LSAGELLWVTIAIWVGGIFALTLLPYLLVPYTGEPTAIAIAYVLFFAGWRPVQVLTQRRVGVKAALVRSLLFVVAAATIAAVLRQSLPTLMRP